MSTRQTMEEKIIAYFDTESLDKVEVVYNIIRAKCANRKKAKTEQMNAIAGLSKKVKGNKSITPLTTGHAPVYEPGQENSDLMEKESR